MYHSVAPNPGHDRFTTDPGRFARQLALLRWAGRRVVSLDELVDTWDKGREAPRRAVALTFDDGYRDNLTYAWPLIQERGYPATLFLVTGCAGGEDAWRDLNDSARPLLAWDEVRQLDAAGFRVHSHTVSHVDLRACESARVEIELKESRCQLETELGHPAYLLAYPYGRHNAEADALAARVGYRAGFSVRPGLNTAVTDRWDRRRIEVRGTDSLLRFALKLWFGDDPLRHLPHWVPSVVRGPTA